MKVSFRVTGRVQGVGYRAFALREARSVSVSGWVRNAADGTVEGQAEGSPEQLADLQVSLRKGPLWGEVGNLEWRVLDEESENPSESLPHPFEIRR